MLPEEQASVMAMCPSVDRGAACHVGRSPWRRHHSRPFGPPPSGAPDPASTSQLPPPFPTWAHCMDRLPARPRRSGSAGTRSPGPRCWVGSCFPSSARQHGARRPGARTEGLSYGIPPSWPPPQEGRHPGGAGAWPSALVMDSEGPPPFPGSPHSADLAPDQAGDRTATSTGHRESASLEGMDLGVWLGGPQSVDWRAACCWYEVTIIPGQRPCWVALVTPTDEMLPH